MLFFKGEVGSKNQKYLLQFNTLNVAINYSYIKKYLLDLGVGEDFLKGYKKH